MKLPNVKGIMLIGKTFVMANRPEMLLGASVVATVGGMVLAAKGGYEARGIIDAERMKLVTSPEAPFDTYADYHEAYMVHVATNDPLTARQKANLTWHCYIPATIAGVTAIGSTTALHIVHVKDKKALAQMALAAIEEVKAEAKQFEKENLGVLEGEEKSKILEARQDADGIATVENSDGEIEELYLVRDALTGRDIWSSAHRIEDALIETCNVLNGSGSCELAHFYNHAGFSNVPMAFSHGWSGVLPSLTWKEVLRDDGRPVREFSFRPAPAEGFDDIHGH